MKIRTFGRRMEGIINFFLDMLLLGGLIKVLVKIVSSTTSLQDL